MVRIRALRMGRKPHKLFKTTIAVDVSGSISNEDVQSVLNEMRWLFHDHAAEVTYLTFDTRITEERQLSGINDVGEIKAVSGRGGTSFKEVFNYVEKNDVQELIVFTDGFGDWDECSEPRNCRVWWLSTGADNPPFGQVFKIDAQR